MQVNWKQVWRGLEGFVQRKSPEILTGLGITGMLTTTVLAVKSTPDAMRRIEQKKKEEAVDKLSVKEVIQVTWPCYIIPVTTCVASMTCLIFASVKNGQRNAALATAYGIAESTLREYREKTKEIVGEKKEKQIQDSVRQEKARLNPPPEGPLEDILEGRGPTLCYDATVGRWFFCDKETLLKAEKRLNHRMCGGLEPYMSLNDFYDEINISEVDIGDSLGWSSKDTIDLEFSSDLTRGGTPYLIFSFVFPPEYDFKRS